MKTSRMLLLFFFVISTETMAQFNFKFPDEWTKDFRVELKSSGGMLDHETDIRFTYDSCIYRSRVQSTTKRNSFLLTEAQRTEILARLRKLKSDSIGSIRVTLDASSESIALFTGDGVFVATDDSENDELVRDFHEVFNYLVDFGMPKRKVKKKNRKS